MAGILIKSKRFKVLVKVSAKKNEILGWNSDKNALRVAIAAPAEKNKANIELIKFLSKKLRPVRIVSGFSSREKILEVLP